MANIKCTGKNDSVTATMRWNIAPGGALSDLAPGAIHDFDVAVEHDGDKNVRFIRNEAQDEASVVVTNTRTDGGNLAVWSINVLIDTLAPSASGTYALPPKPDGVRVKLPA